MKDWIWLAIVGAVFVGVVIGWLIGSAATCGAGCGFDVALFEAIGTWTGGVGVALVGGAYAIYAARRNSRLDKAEADRRAREEAERQEVRERDSARALANMCALRFQPKPGAGPIYDRVHISFQNKIDEVVFAPTLRGVDGEVFQQDGQVAPSRTWGTTIPLSKLGLSQTFADEVAARQALNDDGVKEQLTFEFTIRGYRFVRTGSTVELLSAPTPAASGTARASAISAQHF